MAADFKIYKSNVTNNTMTLEKASATVIEAGDLVTLDAGGLAIKATAASTTLAFCEAGGADGETEIQVIVDAELTLTGTADANFAKANRGALVDLVVNTGNQEIDLGASVTDVFKVLPGTDAGTVGSANEVRVVINKPIV